MPAVVSRVLRPCSQRSGILRYASLSVMLLAAAICQPLVSAQTRAVAVGGSTTLMPLVQSMAREFMRQSPGEDIVVSEGGSGAGIAALIAGELDIANSSRFLTDAEFESAAAAGVYPVPFRLAYGSIIPIVHKSNPVRDLTMEQLRGIYSGEIRNWKQVGGYDRAINVLTRSATSGTFAVWRDSVLQGQAIMAGATLRESSAEMVRTVNRGRGSIGYISLGHLSANIKPLRVGGVMGSRHSVRNGSYPITRSLFMFTRGWPDRRRLEFIDFALDPDKGQRLVEQYGFMPLYRQ